VVSIEDTGAGVPEAFREDVFGRFFSAREGYAVRENSSGLGLYICKQVIEAHEGMIEISDSHNLGGALFQVRL
jgi:signal transduction histidine kinase